MSVRVALIFAAAALLFGCPPRNYWEQDRDEPAPSNTSASASTMTDVAPEDPEEAEIETEAPATTASAGELPALERALLSRLTIRTQSDGTRTFSRACDERDFPCEERVSALARVIHDAAVERGLDPFLLGAMAIKESMLNPFVLGRRREAGILQLHPRGAGHDVPFVQDPSLRERCRAEVDGCQGPIAERAAEYLAMGVERCDDGVEGGLVYYATGHCGQAGPYVERVLTERTRLRELAGE